MSTSSEHAQGVVEDFHKLYYEDAERTWKRTSFLGVLVQKCPMDLWIYQELIYEVRPDVIIETGTADGGSALYMASVCQLIGAGRVLSVDIIPNEDRPKHERITYLTGSSIAPDVVEEVKRAVGANESVMVVLDSDHTGTHVLAEMKAYGDLVTPGSFMIVEDTNVNGHPVCPSFGPGPMEAVAAYLKEDQRFVVDESSEKFYMTFNPGGYLKRI